MSIPLSRGEKAYQVTSHLVLILIALASLIPCLYVVSISLTPFAEMAANGGAYTLIPRHITFVAYEQAFADNRIVNAFLISVLRVLVGTPLHLGVSSAAAYALSKRYLPGNRIFLVLILITFVFGPGLIPYYVVVRTIHLTNTFWMFVIPSAAGAWSILVFRQFFMEMPPELEEAARLDGASDADVLWRIVLPLSGPVYAALGLFNAVGHWNDYLTAVIFVPDANLQPLANVLQRVLTASIEQVTAASVSGVQTASNVNPDAWKLLPPTGLKMAVVVIATLPIVLVYPFLQRYFVKGVLTGAIKG